MLKIRRPFVRYFGKNKCYRIKYEGIYSKIQVIFRQRIYYLRCFEGHEGNKVFGLSEKPGNDSPILFCFGENSCKRIDSLIIEYIKSEQVGFRDSVDVLCIGREYYCTRSIHIDYLSQFIRLKRQCQFYHNFVGFEFYPSRYFAEILALYSGFTYENQYKREGNPDRLDPCVEASINIINGKPIPKKPSRQYEQSVSKGRKFDKWVREDHFTLSHPRE